MTEEKIVRNAVRCKQCSTVLESKYRHDYVRCPCGVFVGGGLDYLRRGWPQGEPGDWMEELSAYQAQAERSS